MTPIPLAAWLTLVATLALGTVVGFFLGEDIVLIVLLWMWSFISFHLGWSLRDRYVAQRHPHPTNQPIGQSVTQPFAYRCPICKGFDGAGNMVSAIIEDTVSTNGKNATWTGKAHLKCIEEYNSTHEPKYSVSE